MQSVLPERMLYKKKLDEFETKDNGFYRTRRHKAGTRYGLAPRIVVDDTKYRKYDDDYRPMRKRRNIYKFCKAVQRELKN